MGSGRDRPEERFARTIVATITGATVVDTDLRNAPPRTVDASLTYDDGRTGSMEITYLGVPSEFQLASLLKKRKGRLPMPGKWKWVITIIDPTELRRIESIYAKVILACEAHELAQPKQLPVHVQEADPDLRWLTSQSSTQFFGIAQPPGTVNLSDFIDLVYNPEIATWSRGRNGIVESLNLALEAELADRVAKLVAADGQERHLFLHVTAEGIGPGAFYDLIHLQLDPEIQDAQPFGGMEIPELHEDPRLPPAITDLWLSNGWGHRVTHWARESGWSHPAYK